VKALNSIKFVLDKILEVLSTLTLAIMTVLVCYQVITRYVFNSPSAISEALSQYLFVWMIMFGSAYVYGSKEHLTIDILKDRFSPKMTMVVDVITNICLFVFILVVCVVGGWLYTQKQYVQVDPSLMISKGILYVSVPFTGVITLFYAVYNCVQAVKEYQAGGHKASEEQPSGTV
jgi:TRAP-type C4-dicarboxylate transport system permease small subunit